MSRRLSKFAQDGRLVQRSRHQHDDNINVAAEFLVCEEDTEHGKWVGNAGYAGIEPVCTLTMEMARLHGLIGLDKHE